MVETITPVVHGGRNRSYWTSVALHAAGATFSASLLGAALGGIGGLAGAPWLPGTYVAVAAAAVVYIGREAFELAIPLPQLRRQVPEWWRTFYDPKVAALLYGIGLGLAFMTYLTFGTFAVVAVGAFASGSTAAGALVVGGFGLARGLSVIVAARRTSDPDEVAEGLGHLKETGRPRRAHVLLLTAILIASIAPLAA